MKKYLKKLLIAVIAAIGVACLAAGLVACDNGKPDDNPDTPNNKVRLIAPAITISGNVISWEAVVHADGYVVYEGEEVVSEQAETTYTITQDFPGTYTYTVKATSTDSKYSESPLSNEQSYKVNPWPLAAPVISISSNGLISWEAVENADGYNIYENGSRIDAITETTYAIMQSNPAIYTYTVTATSTNKAYSTSDASNEVDYKVPLHVSIGVEFPESFEGKLKVGIFDAESGEMVDETEVERDETSTYGSARFIVEWGEYVAKVIEISNNYVATWVRVSLSKRGGSIIVAEKTENNALKVGSNTVTLTLPANESSVTCKYVFVGAQKANGTVYSITNVDEASGWQIATLSKTIINTDQNAHVGSFNAEDKEAIVLTVTYTKQGGAEGETFTFNFEIVDYEVPQYLAILPEIYNLEHVSNIVEKPNEPEDLEDEEALKRYQEALEKYQEYLMYQEMYNSTVNNIYDSCTRHIELSKAGTYQFFFTSGTVGRRVLTLTVNGRDYVLEGGGTVDIPLTPGESGYATIEITVEGDGFGGAAYMSFWVYEI